MALASCCENVQKVCFCLVAGTLVDFILCDQLCIGIIDIFIIMRVSSSWINVYIFSLLLLLLVSLLLFLLLQCTYNRVSVISDHFLQPFPPSPTTVL